MTKQKKIRKNIKKQQNNDNEKKCSIKYQYAAFLNFLCHRESNNKKLKIPGHFSYFGFFTEFSGTNIKFHGIPGFHRMWSP